ncbi:hypothetical protein BT69DRAFT_1351283 [Atractiella rhizophila]|nr:hypothetical protein BT69DRAFT_1351283 [Atractiella rhizophila]
MQRKRLPHSSSVMAPTLSCVYENVGSRSEPWMNLFNRYLTLLTSRISSSTLADSLDDIFIGFFLLQMHKEACAWGKLASDAYRASDSPNSAGHSRLLHNLGSVYEYLGDQASALKARVECIEIEIKRQLVLQAEEARDSTQRRLHLQGLAESLNNLSASLNDEPSKLLGLLEESLAHRRICLTSHEGFSIDAVEKALVPLRNLAIRFITDSENVQRFTSLLIEHSTFFERLLLTLNSQSDVPKSHLGYIWGYFGDAMGIAYHNGKQKKDNAVETFYELSCSAYRRSSELLNLMLTSASPIEGPHRAMAAKHLWDYSQRFVRLLLRHREFQSCVVEVDKALDIAKTHLKGDWKVAASAHRIMSWKLECLYELNWPLLREKIYDKSLTEDDPELEWLTSPCLSFGFEFLPALQLPEPKIVHITTREELVNQKEQFDDLTSFYFAHIGYYGRMNVHILAVPYCEMIVHGFQDSIAQIEALKPLTEYDLLILRHTKTAMAYAQRYAAIAHTLFRNLDDAETFVNAAITSEFEYEPTIGLVSAYHIRSAVLSRRGQNEEAGEWLQKCLDMMERTVGVEGPSGQLDDLYRTVLQIVQDDATKLQRKDIAQRTLERATEKGWTLSITGKPAFFLADG